MKPDLSPFDAYEKTMTLIRSRLNSLENRLLGETELGRAERVAFNVRKIVEGVAWGALSAVEYRNGRILRDQRSKDADKLLAWLDAKGLLTLPSAQRVGKPLPDLPIVIEGVAANNMSLAQIQAAYKRASNLIHERHPESLTLDRVRVEAANLESDAQSLRDWLWMHIMFFTGRGFLLQMGMFGTTSFFGEITKQRDVPSEYA